MNYSQLNLLMKTRYVVLVVVIIHILVSCQQSATITQETTDSSRLIDQHLNSIKDTLIKAEKGDDAIYDLIFNLPEIKEREAYIEQQTHGERHLKLMIAERPQNKEHNYYLVQAGEDNEIRFVTHFNFYIYPAKNYEIKLYDPVKDTIISIGEWRKEKEKKVIKQTY
jgi:hypothetical protein